jgi:DNA repair protein RadA/Sms
VLSSHRDIPLDSNACLIGEVGLGGEVRAVPQCDVRVAEAIKLGFQHIVLPKSNLKNLPQTSEKITIRGVENLNEVRAVVL